MVKPLLVLRLFGKTLQITFLLLLIWGSFGVARANTLVVGQEQFPGDKKMVGNFAVMPGDGQPKAASLPALLATAGKRANYRALLPKIKLLPQTPAGYILYTHYETNIETILGKKIEIPTTKIYIMSGTGKRQKPFIDPGRYRQAQAPWWSANGRIIAFASDHEMAKSALYMDIFVADLAKKRVTRITGNDWHPTKDKGTGTIYGMIMTNGCSFGGGPGDINITCQGLDGKIHHVEGQVQINPPAGNNPAPPATEANITVIEPAVQPDLTGIQAYGYNYTITGIPAGTAWVKCWISKHLGDLKTVHVPINGEGLVPTMNLAQGNFMVSHPSLSPDGRYLVTLSQNPFTQPPPISGSRPQKQLGFDTIAVVDCLNPGQPPTLWNPTQMGGRYTRDPKLSPDGKWIAMAIGEFGTESLAIASLASFVKGQPEVRILRKGKMVFGSHSLGNVNPSWSPDGRSLGFVNRKMMTAGLSGNLCRINLDGSDFRRLTKLAGNQSPGISSWSPDGHKIAYQLVSSRSPQLHVNDLILRNIKSDIWVVNEDGSSNHALTNDGRSGEPAWGRSDN